MENFNTPVVIMAFNRPDLLAILIEKLKLIKPKKVYAICDGARLNKPDETHKVEVVRKLLESLPWSHDLIKIFADQNLGCKQRISSGLTEVFKYEESAIILEDDCIPHPSFFPFVQELLIKYRDNDRIGIISGSNQIENQTKINESYFFSKYSFIWGWATWSRTWKDYDVSMSAWNEVCTSDFLKQIFPTNHRAQKHWYRNFELTAKNQIDTWDHQLTFTNWLHKRINIVPQKNMISNIGFRSDGTHTTKPSRYAELPVSETRFPLIHPSPRAGFSVQTQTQTHTQTQAQLFLTNQILDEQIERTVFSPSFAYRIVRKVRESLRS